MKNVFTMTFLALFILLVLCQVHAQLHNMEQFLYDENEDYMVKVLGKAITHLMSQNLSKNEINSVKIIFQASSFLTEPIFSVYFSSFRFPY